MKNSGAIPRSKNFGPLVETFAVFCSLLVLGCVAAAWFFRHGYILYYGDAQAHLNISRSIIDSLTPGYDQLGTVWLPFLHLLCLPFVGNDWLWTTGLAGTIPVLICFVVAGMCLYLAARKMFSSSRAAAVSVACFALNPNVLYLASIPMTEIVFLAGLSTLLLAAVFYRNRPHTGWLGLGIAGSFCMSLTRYDGWFLIPFAAAWFGWFSQRRRAVTFLIFCIFASAAPLYWAAHNWWETGNALDFYNGPYAPIAIQRAKPYPGYHDWSRAILYYGTACRLVSGWSLPLLGVVGFVCGVWKRALAPLWLLCLTPVFYIWSMHSSGGTPIHVPSLWPFSYYNTRYGIAIVPLAALASGAIILIVPAHWKRFWFAIPLIAVLPWLIHPSPENWVCWKESKVNSDSRRAWTDAAARYLGKDASTPRRILTSFGDVTGIYCRARIHLSDTIHIGNGPYWYAATYRPDLFHPAALAIAQHDDSLDRALDLDSAHTYEPAQSFITKDDPMLTIYRRNQP